MKKKLLFMMINMNIGGTEKALLSMLSEIDSTEYEVTILMLEEYGGFSHSIPSWIEIKYVKEFPNFKHILTMPLHLIASDYFKNKKYLEGLKYLYFYTVTKLHRNPIVFLNHIFKSFEIIKDEYDVAVAYAGPMDFISYYVLNKIKANKKVQWIHFDITKIGFNISFVKKIYPMFDRIFVVSKEGKEKLCQVVPIIADKVEVFHNIISKEQILLQSRLHDGFSDGYDGLRILTVGRLDYIKGQDLCVKTLRLLKEEGYNVKWYCVGDGSFRSELQILIKNYELEDDFILLGATTNPYPYMAQCDLYVQSSRHEGYCITLAETKVFNKPIISTDFTGAKEQLITYHSAKIVEAKACDLYHAITQLIDTKNLESNHFSSEEQEENQLSLLYELTT
ncbi:glycosyltransferase [Turicibacter sanguinis]|uniref:glycosyltransferase n=1 Tax=Turicibacter sanguinis TaxID=154288 RepID=UPI0018A981D1|nr:glycosyltransferase [Turicibacter sanguinis]MDB8551680.1 glycosyltransferase [Turicibacter sanguinis]